MNSDSARITHNQLVFLGMLFLDGILVKSRMVIQITGNDSWVLAFSALILFIPQMSVLYLLWKIYPGRGLYEISEEVFGSIGGKIVNSLYLFFFLNIAAINLIDLSTFVKQVILTETNEELIIIVIMLAMIYTLSKGLEATARLAPLIVIVTGTGFLINTIITMGQANFDFLLPLFNRPFVNYVKGTLITATLPYGESMFLMALFPLVVNEKKPAALFAKVGVFTCFALFITHIKETLSLGPVEPFLSAPLYEAVRMVEFGSDVTRLEIFFALTILLLTYCKLSLCMFVAMRGWVSITKVSDDKPFIFLACIFLIIYSMVAFNANQLIGESSSDVTSFIWAFFEYVIPVITLIVAAIRTAVKKTSSHSAKGAV